MSMSMSEILSAIATIVVSMLGVAIKKWLRNAKLQALALEALELLRIRMNVAYKTLILPKVEAARAAGSPGGEKITAEERAQLLGFVWTTALQEAEGPLYDFLVAKGREWAEAKVEDILLDIKAKSAAGV